MCGISGFILLSPEHPRALVSLATRMSAAIVHRGPDAAGTWFDPLLGLALSHQRLAVLDLSARGQQPMHSPTGRFVITFNGEIYNHLAIRSEMEAASLAPHWRSHSDTETLLAAIEAWGLEPALQRCAGMWAFALLDRRERRLHLARDRFGEKPLYWGLSGSGQQRALVFGSEPVALRAYPPFNNPVDRQALAELLRFGYVPAPLSIYTGISKLLPGHLVSIHLPLDSGLCLPSSRPWWRFNDLIVAGYTSPYGSVSEGLEMLENTLNQVIADQAIADVPLGAFLSGGIDSSLVSALLQQKINSPLRTFTIAFEEAAFNEAPYARAIAAHLGTDHSEIPLTSADALELIPQLPLLYSEPFADSSQLPTYLVCREARAAGLTVALSGDGGDELFGGYNRYLWATRVSARLASVPAPLRRSLSSAISLIPPSVWDAFGAYLRVPQLGQKLYKFAASSDHLSNSDEFYRSLVTLWRDPAALIFDYSPSEISIPTAFGQLLPPCLKNDPVARTMAWDVLGYLPDDILVKVDRAAMSVGLETRAPFLDHRVAAVAWRLPMHMKIRAGITKWTLRQLLYKHVPRELIDRPKAGFSMPIGKWLRGPLRDWAEDLLHPDRLQREGYLRPEPISQLWQQHLSGRYDHTSKLWTVLMLQAWLEEWG